MKDRELKDRKEKIKKEIEKLFNKLIIVFKDDIDVRSLKNMNEENKTNYKKLV